MSLIKAFGALAIQSRSYVSGRALHPKQFTSSKSSPQFIHQVSNLTMRVKSCRMFLPDLAVAGNCTWTRTLAALKIPARTTRLIWKRPCRNWVPSGRPCQKIESRFVHILIPEWGTCGIEHHIGVQGEIWGCCKASRRQQSRSSTPCHIKANQTRERLEKKVQSAPLERPQTAQAWKKQLSVVSRPLEN